MSRQTLYNNSAPTKIAPGTRSGQRVAPHILPHDVRLPDIVGQNMRERTAVLKTKEGTH